MKVIELVSRLLQENQQAEVIIDDGRLMDMDIYLSLDAIRTDNTEGKVYLSHIFTEPRMELVK